MEANEALIVPMEDDPEGRRELHQVLEQQGYRASLVTDAVDALRQAGERKPDMVLLISRRVTEVELGFVDRFTAASPATRIVLLCRKGDWSEYQSVLDHGGDDLLVPPLHCSDMRNALRRNTKPSRIRRRSASAELSRQG